MCVCFVFLSVKVLRSKPNPPLKYVKSWKENIVTDSLKSFVRKNSNSSPHTTFKGFIVLAFCCIAVLHAICIFFVWSVVRKCHSQSTYVTVSAMICYQLLCCFCFSIVAIFRFPWSTASTRCEQETRKFRGQNYRVRRVFRESFRGNFSRRIRSGRSGYLAVPRASLTRNYGNANRVWLYHVYSYWCGKFHRVYFWALSRIQRSSSYINSTFAMYIRESNSVLR